MHFRNLPRSIGVEPHIPQIWPPNGSRLEGLWELAAALELHGSAKEGKTTLSGVGADFRYPDED